MTTGISILACNQAMANDGTAHLRGCIYTKTPSTEQMVYTFKTLSDYCMYVPDSKTKGTKSLTITVPANKSGFTCSEGDGDQKGYLSVQYSSYDDDMARGSCSAYISQSLVSFSAGSYSAGAKLLWGGLGGSKYWRYSQVYYEGDNDKIRLCQDASLCYARNVPEDTIFYNQDQDLYVIYTPEGT